MTSVPWWPDHLLTEQNIRLKRFWGQQWIYGRNVTGDNYCDDYFLCFLAWNFQHPELFPQGMSVSLSLCHRSSFNPWCDVSGIFFLKTFYVSLIYKCRIVFKIFTEPFLSNTLPWRGEISNISNRQTKYAWKYVITLLILLSQPYAPQETNIYKAGMLLCTRRICIL